MSIYCFQIHNLIHIVCTINIESELVPSTEEMIKILDLEPTVSEGYKRLMKQVFTV